LKEKLGGSGDGWVEPCGKTVVLRVRKKSGRPA